MFESPSLVMEKNSKKNQPSPPDSSASKKDPKKDEEVGEPGSENKKSRFSKLKERISQKNETDPKSSNEENKGASPKGSKDVKKDLKAPDEKGNEEEPFPRKKRKKRNRKNQNA